MTLDGWLHYQDPTLPQFSSLTYLYVAILALIHSIEIVGRGSAAGGMALLFAGMGVHMGRSDSSEKRMDALVEKSEKAGYIGWDIAEFQRVQAVVRSALPSQYFVFSPPHGNVGGTVLEALMPSLSRDNHQLDYGNEHYERTSNADDTSSNGLVHDALAVV
ncbi:hypothetical protein BU24DRAFT_464702 [Aaosphaeria arxii CBS 175.79]|uniref:Uncharacterized protein n=1 Tax=Aaosphaeria arxii CBS 175.79 TaxID=1450172 RepID=A0A6A5XMB6_9PLEO|nr:uncharacterized protein BU24DRAFT_464702 [Aaosphaeria arxii CBS 175.79]KAF2013987.1 hypothetical protein BU24DRAFT_464702 [Aaosphaeria arxii CBS 175.79]